MPHPQDLNPDAEIPAFETVADQLAVLDGETRALQRLAMLGTVSAGLAHEINNVLTPAMGYAQLAQSHPEDGMLQAKALAKSMHAIATTSQIVRSMLGLAADAGEGDADVHQVAVDTLACISRNASRGIEIRVDVEKGLTAAIRPVALQQVFLNLALNAIEAMHGQDGQLTIRGERLGDGATRLSVHDSGPGIPDEIAARLFEPFVTRRGDASSPGTGLGLAICRELVLDAGGAITAGSSHEGAVFTIDLPARVPAT